MLLMDVIEVVDVMLGVWFLVLLLDNLLGLRGLEVGFGVFGYLGVCFIKKIMWDLWNIKLDGMI